MNHFMRRPLRLVVLAMGHVKLGKGSLRLGFTTATGHVSSGHVLQRRSQPQHPRTMMSIHRRPRQQYNFARSKCEIATLQMHVQATQSLCPRKVFSCLIGLCTVVFHMQMTKPHTTTKVMAPWLLLPAYPPMSAYPRTSGAAERRISLTAAATMPQIPGPLTSPRHRPCLMLI